MKFFKYFGVCAIMVFSFYYTDQIANFVLEKNELYQKIARVKDDYQISSVSAVIEDKYITPGLNGSKVNVKNSYYNMKNLDLFNEYYLVFDEIKPQVSLEEHKDKIIRKGNPAKNNIAFILENDEKIKTYFQDKNIPADLLVTLDNYDSKGNFELINNDYGNYEKMESLLNNANLNVNLCLVNSSLETICRDQNKYLIEPLILNNTTFLNIKNNLNKGDIILIKKGTNLDNIKLLLDNITFKDITITTVKNLISESK